MRKLFIDEAEADGETAVYNLCPWAAVIIRAEGGWWAFESIADADVWENQR